jgi:hypothetical protein
MSDLEGGLSARYAKVHTHQHACAVRDQANKLPGSDCTPMRWRRVDLMRVWSTLPD